MYSSFFFDCSSLILGLKSSAIACLLLACTACAGGTSASKTIDACELVAKAEFEQALGTSLADPKKMQSGEAGAWMSHCLYSHSGTDGYVSGSILIRQSDVEPDATKAYEAYMAGRKKEPSLNYSLEDVAGIGNRAVWDEKLQQLSVFVPGTMILVSAKPGKGVSGLEICKSLALKALLKLK